MGTQYRTLIVPITNKYYRLNSPLQDTSGQDREAGVVSNKLV